MEIQSRGEGGGTAAGSAERAPKRVSPASLTPPRRACRLHWTPPTVISFPSLYRRFDKMRTGPRPSGKDDTGSETEPMSSRRRSPRRGGLGEGGKFLDPVQVALPALRAESRISAGDSEDHTLPVLARRRLGRRGLNTEQAPALLQILLPPPVGKQPIVTDAHESIRQNVQQEAAEEFLYPESHLSALTFPSVIL